MKSEEKVQKFSSRLSGIRARRGLTQADLAANIGVSVGAVGNWESEVNIPGPNYLRKLSDYLGVTIEYLLGETDIEKPGNYPDQKTSGLKVEDATRSGEDWYYQLARSLEEFGCPDKKAFALEWSGDSMEPKYSTGDVLVVSPNSQLQDGDLVAAKAVGGVVYFKIYHRMESGRGKIMLTSYNPVYPPLEFSIEEFRYIYPIWSVIRMLKKRGQVEERNQENGS